MSSGAPDSSAASPRASLRKAGQGDLPRLLESIERFNRHEAIKIASERIERGLGLLLADDSLGRAWLIETGGQVAGHTILTFGFDLEFGGRDAWITDLYLDEAQRGQGIAQDVLRLVLDEARALGVQAVHLQVREANAAALAAYERVGFKRVERLIYSRNLQGA